MPLPGNGRRLLEIPAINIFNQLIMKNITQVLYLDSEQHNLNAFRAHFRQYKEYKLHLFRTGVEAVFALHTEKIDIIITDQPRPDITGFEFVKVAGLKDPLPVIIALTVHRDTQVLDLALKDGALFRYFEKPVSFQLLLKALEEAKETISRHSLL